MKPPIASGCLSLFRLFGIQVYLHWSWFFAAAFFVEMRSARMSSTFALWSVLALFGIVLMHEFGHALACRSVGGRANTIILWPLGGVAFVKPPPRPGPILWSIAAGPLVNVALVPVTLALMSWANVPLDLESFRGLNPTQQFVMYLAVVNFMLLVFNMLPVYPLDGGQILQAILWFFVGRTMSLRIVAAIGLAAASVGGMFALLIGQIWLLIMAMFLVWQAVNGLRTANALARLEKKQREEQQWWSPLDAHERMDLDAQGSVRMNPWDEERNN